MEPVIQRQDRVDKLTLSEMGWNSAKVLSGCEAYDCQACRGGGLSELIEY